MAFELYLYNCRSIGMLDEKIFAISRGLGENPYVL
jgi:hypothetical protein